MPMPEMTDGYTHSEFLDENPYTQQQLKAQRLLSIQQIAYRTGDAQLGVNAGVRVFDLVEHERTGRLAHHHRLTHALAALSGSHILDPNPANIAQSAMYRFTTIANIQRSTVADHLFFEHSTGVSGELGHVDQYGVWESTEALDSAVRALPEQCAPDNEPPLRFTKAPWI